MTIHKKECALSTVLDMYQQLCTAGLLTEKRRKNSLTSLPFLAKCYDSTPEQLMITRDLEATYADRLRDYFMAQGKHLTREG